jgi:hypothetical protein
LKEQRHDQFASVGGYQRRDPLRNKQLSR